MSDILQQRQQELKRNPFNPPQDYFTSLEEKVQARIQTGNRNTIAGFLKPALFMACCFGMIFLLGYGAMKLTRQHESGTEQGLSMYEYDLVMMVMDESIEESSEDTSSINSEDEIIDYIMMQGTSSLYAVLYDSDNN